MAITEDRTASTEDHTPDAPAKLIMFNIDCPDPGRSAAFYSAVLGWPVTHSEEQYAMIAAGGAAIGFGRVADYLPPAWPGDPGVKRYHLDLAVGDLAAAAATCRALGATTPDFQPGADRWRVMLDPAGHPFCLCLST
ncbi:MAG TPA: VOC family protein [Catenuloplanes sp.]|jgi:predicted enzyme related to lactoylglutathione lyase